MGESRLCIHWKRELHFSLKSNDVASKGCGKDNGGSV